MRIDWRSALLSAWLCCMFAGLILSLYSRFSALFARDNFEVEGSVRHAAGTVKCNVSLITRDRFELAWACTVLVFPSATESTFSLGSKAIENVGVTASGARCSVPRSSLNGTCTSVLTAPSGSSVACFFFRNSGAGECSPLWPAISYSTLTCSGAGGKGRVWYFASTSYTESLWGSFLFQ